MSRRPRATVVVLKQPHIAPGAVWIDVGCRNASSGITHLPAPGRPDPTILMLITIAIFVHEERCGRCDTEEAHARGDQQARQYAEAAAGISRVESARRYAEMRQN